MSKPERPPWLVHRFARGLRFDAELQIRQGHRWRKLPLPSEQGTRTGLALCLSQALAVLGLPGLGSLPERALVGDGRTREVDELQQVLDGLRLEHPQCCVTSFDWPPTGEHAPALDILKQVLEAGGVAIVSLQEKGQPGSWSLLVGYEQDRASVSPRAALLLDPRWGVPWCSAHNARLVPQTGGGGWLSRGLQGQRQEGTTLRALCMVPLDTKA